MFISHASEDKPRLRTITDRLREAGLHLWIDRPEELGYDAREIGGSIDRIIAGTTWQGSIQDAVRESACVLLVGSESLRLQGKEVWHEEILVSSYLRKLITVVIDEVDVRDTQVGKKLSPTQYKAIRLGPSGTPLDKASRTNLDLLPNDVRALIRELDRGSFVKDVPFVTRERCERFLTMLDRELPSQDLVRAERVVTAAYGPRESRPDAFGRRLWGVDLPLGQRRPGQKAAAGRVPDRMTRRAQLLTGIGGDRQPWEGESLTWPDPGAAGVERALQSIADQLEDILEDELPGDTSEARLRSLHPFLESHDRRIFVMSTLADAPAKRDAQRQLLTEVSRALAQVPTDRFRLHLHLVPTATSWWARFFQSHLEQWMHEVHAAQGCHRPVHLGLVERDHLEEWCALMSTLVQSSLDEVRSAVAEAFGSATTLSFAALHERMYDRLLGWELRAKWRPPPSNPADARFSDV